MWPVRTFVILASVEEGVHPAVARLTRKHGNELVAVLSESVSGADLTAVLLEVVRRRAAVVTPAKVLAQYERDRFVRPAEVDARRLLAIEHLALDTAGSLFTPIVAAPLTPLGTHSVVAGVDQNRVVTTVRGSEVAADPTNSLALEAAVRRRELLSSDRRSTAKVHLASLDRVVRAQRFDDARSFAHFSLLGLVSAGRDTGGFAFESAALRQHIDVLIHICRRVGIEHVVVALTDFSEQRHSVLADLARAIEQEGVAVSIWPERTAARGYYPHLCFKLSVVSDEVEVEVADGGLVNWTQLLVGSKKERLMISGLSLERLAHLDSLN
jgi:hypothetical protein